MLTSLVKTTISGISTETIDMGGSLGPRGPTTSSVHLVAQILMDPCFSVELNTSQDLLVRFLCRFPYAENSIRSAISQNLESSM